MDANALSARHQPCSTYACADQSAAAAAAAASTGPWVITTYQLLESFKANRYDETHRGGPPATAATARLMSGLTALRQACCHPQIARSAEAQVFGEAATKHGRLSMKQVRLQGFPSLPSAC